MKICVHHIIGGCPNCVPDEFNTCCPYYMEASQLVLVTVHELPLSPVVTKEAKIPLHRETQERMAHANTRGTDVQD